MNGRPLSRHTALILGTLLLLGGACSNTDSTSEPDPATESVAYKLAIVDGDASKEAAFQDAIDCIMASGIEGAETEEKVGDTLYASWEAGGKPGSLLEWAQTLCQG
jgi:hypothetical protein